MRYRSTWFQGLLFSVTLTVACACTPPPPKGQLSALADSAKAISAQVEDTYPRIERLQRNAQAANAATIAAPKTEDYVIATPVGEALAKREDKLAALVAYFELLSTFASTDYGADVDKASVKLGGSLQNLSKDPRAQQAAGILATATDAIGREIVEHKRRAALQEAMGKAQQPVTTIVALLQEDNDIISKNIVRPSGEKLTDSLIVLRGTRGLPITARQPLDQQVTSSIEETRMIQASLAEMSLALGRIPAAHQEIRDLLEQKQSPTQQLEQLVGEAQRINRFYKSLKQD